MPSEIVIEIKSSNLARESMARATRLLAETFDTIPDDFENGINDARDGAHWLLEVAQTINEDPAV